MKTKGLPKRKSHLFRTMTESKDQAMDQKNGLEAETFRARTRTSLMTDLRRTPHWFIRISVPGRVTETTIRTKGDQIVNAQSNHSVGAMELALENDFSTIRKGICEALLTLHEKISHKTVHTAKQ